MSKGVGQIYREEESHQGGLRARSQHAVASSHFECDVGEACIARELDEEAPSRHLEVRRALAARREYGDTTARLDVVVQRQLVQTPREDGEVVGGVGWHVSR